MVSIRTSMSGPDRSSADPRWGRAAEVGVPSVTEYPPGASHGPRALLDHELVWVIKGGGRVILEHRELDIPSGSLLLLGPGPIHTFEWDRRRPTIHGYVHFTLTGRPTPAPLADLPMIQPFTADDPLAALCRYLI